MEALSDYVPDVLADIVNSYEEMRALDFRSLHRLISKCLPLPLHVLSIILSFDFHALNKSDARMIRVPGNYIGCIGHQVFWLNNNWDKQVKLICDDTYTGVYMSKTVFRLHKFGMHYIAQSYQKIRIYNSQFQKLDTLRGNWSIFNDELYYVRDEVLYRWCQPEPIRILANVTYCFVLGHCLNIEFKDKTIGLYQNPTPPRHCRSMYTYNDHIYAIEDRSVHDITTNNKIIHDGRTICLYAHGPYLWFKTCEELDVLCDIREMMFTSIRKECGLEFKNGNIETCSYYPDTYYIFQ